MLKMPKIKVSAPIKIATRSKVAQNHPQAAFKIDIDESIFTARLTKNQNDFKMI